VPAMRRLVATGRQLPGANGVQAVRGPLMRIDTKRRLAVGAAAAAALLLASGAGAAVVKLGTFVFRVDGGFRPQALPRRAYAPISFQGHAEIGTTDSRPPPALLRGVIDFDRAGRLTTRGLPVCPPERIEGTAPAEARRRCRGAIVGRGHVGAAVTLSGQPTVRVRSPLTLFNGPRRDGHPTVLAQARTTYPSPETYVVVAPLERRAGDGGYRIAFDLPPIAGGYGALTHVDLKIGRRYRFHRQERSYASAHCSNGILETSGRFDFADGTVISGTLFKPCRVRG
jgi:hypothetical protein